MLLYGLVEEFLKFRVNFGFDIFFFVKVICVWVNVF